MFDRYIKKKCDEQRHDTLSSSGFARHSLFYHSQFEGWTEERVPKANGKGTRIVRTYTSKYYRAALDDRQRKRRKLLYPALWAIAALCYGAAACMDAGTNYVWYAALPAALCVPALAWILLAFATYLPADEYLKIPDYKNGVRMLRASLTAAVCCMLASALVAVLCLALHPDFWSAKQALCVSLLVLSAATLHALRRLEGAVEYEEIPAGAKPDEKGGAK